MFLRTTLFILSAILVCGCIKQIPENKSAEVTQLIQKFERENNLDLGISKETVDSCLVESARRTDVLECFTTNTLTEEVFPNFGRQYPDLQPAAQSHIQDVNFCGLGRLPVFVYSRADDGAMEYRPDMQWDSTFYYINGEYAGRGPYLQFATFTVPCEGFVPECNGTLLMKVECWYNNVEYTREDSVFVLINNSPSPLCEDVVTVEPWYTSGDYEFYFDPYEFIEPETAKGDYTNNYRVESGDLIYVLSRFCTSHD
jgi:hypothetical protein